MRDELILNPPPFATCILVKPDSTEKPCSYVSRGAIGQLFVEYRSFLRARHWQSSSLSKAMDCVSDTAAATRPFPAKVRTADAGLGRDNRPCSIAPLRTGIFSGSVGLKHSYAASRPPKRLHLGRDRIVLSLAPYHASSDAWVLRQRHSSRRQCASRFIGVIRDPAIHIPYCSGAQCQFHAFFMSCRCHGKPPWSLGRLRLSTLLSQP